VDALVMPHFRSLDALFTFTDEHVPTPANKYVIQIPQIAPDSGSINDRLIVWRR